MSYITPTFLITNNIILINMIVFIYINFFFQSSVLRHLDCFQIFSYCKQCYIGLFVGGFFCCCYCSLACFILFYLFLSFHCAHLPLEFVLRIRIFGVIQKAQFLFITPQLFFRIVHTVFQKDRSIKIHNSSQ